MRDIETIDAELRLVAALRRAARERGGPLPSIDVADALLDERRGLAEWATTAGREFLQFPVSNPARAYSALSRAMSSNEGGWAHVSRQATA